MIDIELIVGEASCRSCGGRGRIAVELNPIELIEIIAPSLREVGKIQAIKDVRARWDLGLKQAKEVVEAYQEFSNSLIKTIVPLSDR